MSKSIRVVGTIVMDIIARAERIPRHGETIVSSSQLNFRIGGKGFNQAFLAAKEAQRVSQRSIRVCLSSATGNDAFGMIARKLLAEQGVELSVAVSPHPTGSGSIHMDKRGLNSIIVLSGGNDHTVIDEARFADATAVLCQLELPLGISLQAFQSVPKQATRILNAAPVPFHMTNVFDKILHISDVIIVNEVEADDLFKLLCIESTSSNSGIFQRFPMLKAFILTRGPQGVRVCTHDGQNHDIAGTNDVALDTVGAGDCFVAAFAVSMIDHEKSFLDAASDANRVAGRYVATVKQAMTLADVLEPWLGSTMVRLYL